MSRKYIPTKGFLYPAEYGVPVIFFFFLDSHGTFVIFFLGLRSPFIIAQLTGNFTMPSAHPFTNCYT